jgi:hypothetical protein
MPLLSQPLAVYILPLLLPAPIYSALTSSAPPTLPTLSLIYTDPLLSYISSIPLPLSYTVPTLILYLSSLLLLYLLVLGTPRSCTLPASLPLYALYSPLC